MSVPSPPVNSVTGCHAALGYLVVVTLVPQPVHFLVTSTTPRVTRLCP